MADYCASDLQAVIHAPLSRTTRLVRFSAAAQVLGQIFGGILGTILEFATPIEVERMLAIQPPEFGPTAY